MRNKRDETWAMVLMAIFVAVILVAWAEGLPTPV